MGSRFPAVLAWPHRAAVIALLAGGIASAQAPLNIGTVSDRSTYVDRAEFRVPTIDGYTYSVLLDGRPVPTDLTHRVTTMDYHELVVARTNVSTRSVTNRLVRFIVVDSSRGNPEKGLTRWEPLPLVDSTAAEMVGARLRLIAPQEYPAGLPIPIVVWVEDAHGNERRVNGTLVAPGFEADPVPVRRGVGSGFLPPASVPGPIAYHATLQPLQTNKVIRIESATDWIQRAGVLNASEDWPPNSRIHLTGGLTIPAGLSLTIGAGTVVRLDPLVNITNDGHCVINGTVEQPVILTATNVVQPERPQGAWGGFILHGSGAVLDAHGAILAGGGGASRWEFGDGSSHKPQQPVLFFHSGAAVQMTDCAVLNSAGQVGNGYNSNLTLDRTVWQRAVTGGEYVGGTIRIDHSAVIEFPNDDGVVDAAIADGDYDAIYFTTGTHVLSNSLFGWAKDDAIDSGSGGAGTVTVTNCWVESALHEALAWSGSGRLAASEDVVLMNCGQGLECGWSSSDGSPDVSARRLLSTGNGVGVRFGDNYDWDYWGFVRVTDSVILHNYRNVWGLNWDNWLDGIYTPTGPFRMEITGNSLSQADPAHPENRVWNPATDGSRLAHWMTTPPDAPVGIGFAVRSRELPMTVLLSGVPVRLSSFTTQPVSVLCEFEDSLGGVLSSKTLTFAPGETVMDLVASGFDLPAHAEVVAVLADPAGGEVTGPSRLTFRGVVPRPDVECWVAGNRLPAYRMAEGMLVRLTGPLGLAVRVDYGYEAGGTALAKGTLTFLPGETVKRVEPPAVDPAGVDAVVFQLSRPVNATLGGITSVRYGAPVLEIGLATAARQLDRAAFESGVPVSLNFAATTNVAVDFRVEADGRVLTNGTVTLEPGQSSQTLAAPTVNARDFDLIRVSLDNPRSGQLGAVSNVFFLPAAAVPSPELVSAGSAWRYLDTGGDAGTAWRPPAYEDRGWSNGIAQLGFGDNDEVTPIRRVGTNGQVTVTYYFRRQFDVPNPEGFTNVHLWLLRDDGGVVYLNGTEAYRSPSLPAPPTEITYQTLADAQGGSAPPDNSVDTADLDPALLVAGVNVVAVEIHQHDTGSSDVSFDLALTGEPAPPPPPQRLFTGWFDGQLVVAWWDDSFSLQQSEQVSGPWTTILERSPVNVPIFQSTPQRFLRLHRP